MLAPRTRIAVVSPSGVFTPARLHAGMALLQEWGYQPELLPVSRAVVEGASHRYLAGQDSARLAELQQAFSGDYGAVWMARGGYGLARLLPSLDFRRMAKVPFFGFSDGTVVLNALARRGFPAVHGPVLQTLADHLDDGSRCALRTFLSGEKVPLEGEFWVEGEAEGPVVGGNLCVLASLCGTEGQVNAYDALLLLEELNEAPYKVDRMLTQLAQAGVFEGLRGVLLGEFLNCQAPGGAGYTVEDVLRERLEPLGVPILAGLPVGHGARNWPLKLGTARLWEGGVVEV